MRFIKYYFLILFLILSGCSSLPRAITPVEPTENCSDRKAIYVFNRGWHTELIISAPDLNKEIPGLTARFPTEEYYEIGWGDLMFYQSDEKSVGLALRAVLASPGAVVHVVGFRENPEEHYANNDVRRIRLNSASYINLLKYVQSSFAIGPDGNIVSLKHGLRGDSQFYSGVGKYHLFNTCNKWTAKALSSAGLDINPFLKLSASSIIRYLDKQAPASVDTNTPRICNALFH
jgi:uncharacterized protein (TIGR02117 family)